MCSPFRVSKLPQDVVSCCSLRLHFRDVSAVAKCSVKSNSQVGLGMEYVPVSFHTMICLAVCSLFCS